MRVRGLIAVCAVLVLCGTPLASAMTDRSGRLFDGSPPVVNVPADISTEATSADGADVTFDVTYSDPDDEIVTSGCDRGSGLFPIATTTVTCSATDAMSNTTTASFTVTVTEPPPPPDTTAPTITTPATLSFEATSSSGAAISYSVGFSDPDDAVSASGCDPISGTVLGLGSHLVTCNATDSHSNSSSASFTANVVDTTAPSVGGVADIATTTTSPGGKVITFTKPGANDLVAGSVSVDCTKDSGDNFPVGHTLVVCSANDGRGNTGSSSFNVDITLVDNTAPVLSGGPANISTTTDSPGGKIINYTKPTANDNIDGPLLVSCTTEPGATFPVGSTNVVCSATDAHSNTGTDSFTVNITLVDNTDPVLSGVPANIAENTTVTSGKVISYTKPTATDNLDGPLPVTCGTHEPNTNFPVGHTVVTCSATDAHNNVGSASFNVDITLVDTTAPTFSNVPGDISQTTTVLAGKAVSFTKPTATDNVDGTLPGSAVTCSPASNFMFPIGETTVTCSASDAHNNTGQATFTVTVTLVDVIDPVLTNHANIAETTEVNQPKAVSYTKPTATDNIDGTLPVTCTPASGSNFPQNGSPTTVTCTATDAHGNTGTETFTITVTLVDTTKPVLSGVPGNISENTEVPTGKVINYSLPTASDNLDGPRPVSCTKASGTNFAVGTTTVSCSATDTHGNTGSASFDVVITLIDITKPVLSNVPANITTEANGPSGSKANFVPPTAVDNLDGPMASVPCTPGSGSTFPLGETTVNCSATDAHGNTGTATFKVKVQDTTPPTLIAPGDTSVYATTEAGADAADQGPITKFIFGFNVSDIADANPKVTANSPQFFPVGTTTVIFTAVDANGNKSTASAKLTVLAKPAPGTTPPPLPPPTDNRPPGNVQSVLAKGGDGRATFKWTNPTDADFDHTEITRTTSLTAKATGTGTVVYNGKGTTYTDKGLQNGVEYRYVLASVDKNGNKSAGVAIVVLPKKAFLKTPADGARLKQIPKQFIWVADPKADYYNLQLYIGGTLLFKSTAADPKKVLSTWTTTPRFVFKSPWKWEGRSYKMTKGVYTWYVWPGYGSREAAKYGALMGSATFQVTPTKPKPKPKPKKPK